MEMDSKVGGKLGVRCPGRQIRKSIEGEGRELCQTLQR